jgi:hypothetical protein
MTSYNELVASGAASPGDAEAITHLKQAIAGGKHWFVALLEAMGLWASAEEVTNGQTNHYLIDGEAFDWQRLAERLLGTVDGLLPEDEKNALLAHGRPPLNLSAGEVKGLIGSSKYGQYLNYFYGVTVEEALLRAVQGEIDKEKQLSGYRRRRRATGEAYLRIYNASRDALLKRFRQEKGHPPNTPKEFTHWRFKYRLKQCEKARIASDTKKALAHLKKQWQQNGVSRTLVAVPEADQP